MKKKVSILLASLLAVCSLTACSSSSTTSNSNVADSNSAVVENSNASNTSNTSNTISTTGGYTKENTGKISAEDSKALASIHSAGEGFLNLVNGIVEIPEKTTHFAALDLSHLDHLTALGITPYAANIPNYPTDESTPAQLTSWTDGFGRLYENYNIQDDVIQLSNTLDIETLLLLEPDYLIVGDSQIESLSLLESVAPVYMIDSTLGYDEDSYSNWQETLRVIGAITGYSEKAEEVISDYYNLLDSYVEELGGTMAGKSAMIFQLDTKGIQYAAMETHPHIYKDLEFDAPVNVPSGSRETVTVEALVDINPDYIFMTVESYEDLAVLEESPIWQNLTAVKNGNVFEFAHYGWNRTKGPLGAVQKLTEVCEFILHGTQTSLRFQFLEDGTPLF